MWVEAFELLVCTAAIYVCFIGYGLLQEQLYKDRYGPNKERFDHRLVASCFTAVVKNPLFMSLTDLCICSGVV